MAGQNGTRRLKSLELHGYKSFASKTLFEFGRTVTAVVGPNGSGKSNIADAIRWVLGEQAYSLLRGRKTEDMIFAGSEARPRAGMAAATITFDNSDGWLPIDFAEVTVSRRAHRDGQNEYLLNGQRVRLRDVQDLLGSVGLAERNYTVIGQGLVDSVLSLRPDERVKMFEEAAGITVHRLRKEEAARRLEKTQRNLERAKDILAEIRPRLRSLVQQAERASEYGRLREELRAALFEWYGYHWHRLQVNLQAIGQESAAAAARRDMVLASGESYHRSLLEANARVTALRAEIQSAVETAGTLTSNREDLERKLAVSEERLRWLEEEERSLDKDLLSMEVSRADLTDRVVAAREETRRKEASLPGLPALSRAEGPAIPSGQAGQAEKRLEQLAVRFEEIGRQTQRFAQEQAALETRLELAEHNAQYSDRFSRRLREAADRGVLSELIGDLNQQLEVQPAHQAAISAALDGFQRGIIFRDSTQLEAALDWLKQEEPKEKLALLPQSQPRQLPRLTVPNDPDCLGVAADLVRVSRGYEGVVNLLLSRTLVVRDRQAAKRVVEGLPLDARVVTLAGQVFYPAGHVLISVNGKASQPDQATLKRLREVVLHSEQLESERLESITLRDRLEVEMRGRLSQEVFLATQAKLEGLEEQYRELEVKAARQRELVERNRSAQSKTRLETYDLRGKLGTVRSELSPAAARAQELQAALTDIETARAEMLAEDARARDGRREAEDRYTQAQIEAARLQQQATDMERRILDDFALVNPESEARGSEQEPVALAGIIGQLPQFDQLSAELEGALNRKRGQLRRMGSVDPRAKDEYEEVKGRHDFLHEQIQDLTEAEAQLRQVILELEELMGQEFLRTFEAVAEAFEGFFVRLFGGGSARLRFQEEEAAIEIEVKLPGHRDQGLAMLSGGERSLTAVALVFALLKLSPTPFCVLDEVDAMLDDRNVERFGTILRELSARTQFLVITHNRQTIQAAEVLYGISVGSDNASDVLSLRLDEVEERIAA